MEITRLGHNRKLIVVVHDPQRPIAPRIVDKTRWILLHPTLLPPLENYLLSTTRRAEGISGGTWQALHAPYLLAAHPITHHGPTTIYPFVRQGNSITVIHTAGETIQPERVGSSSLILCGRLSFEWLRELIQRSPRSTPAAIPYLKDHGLRPSSLFLREIFHDIPAIRAN